MIKLGNILNLLMGGLKNKKKKTSLIHKQVDLVQVGRPVYQ